MFISKRMKDLYKKQKEGKKCHNLSEFIENIKSHCNAKFIESIDLNIGLNINPRKSEENIRGSFVLPHGVQKKIKIAAFVSSDMEEEAKKAGADIVGLEDLIAEIKSNEKVHFDICFTTVENLPKLVSIAKILGQNGVMPNRKDGTVTNQLAQSIQNVKEGKNCLFRNDSAGYIHLSVGKANTDSKKIEENIKEFVKHVKSLKPPKVKEMIKTIYISSTMGIGHKIPVSFI